MPSPSLLTAKNRTLPRLLIDSSMDYRSRSGSSLSFNTSTTESSSMHSHSSGDSLLVRGLYDFDGSGAEQLSFHKGDVLEVIYRDSSGWWAAHLEEETFIGWIPGSYVEPLSRGSSEQPESAPVVWADMSPDSGASPNSELLVHYLHHPLVASPDNIVSPESIGTHSKAIPRRTMSIFGPREGSTIELPSSPMLSGLVRSASDDCNPLALQSPEMPREPASAEEMVWSASDLLKLCPSSPSVPPPPPPTPQTAALRRNSLPEDALSPASTSDPNGALEFPSSDSYSTCHPQCAHRRLIRLQDGLYFRPLSVLVETMSIDSLHTEDDPSDSVISPDSPSERSRSFDSSSSRRLDKIRQITGDDIAQAVHDARSARASCPWYLRPIFDDDEIRYDYNGSVASGTLPALVEALTSEPLHPSLGANLRHAFFSTFRTMGSSTEVYDLLLKNFNQEQPLGLTGSEADIWRLRRLYPTQRRVLDVFKNWLSGYRMIEEDPPIAQQLQAFLASITSPAEIAHAAEQVMETLKHLTFAVPTSPPTIAEKPLARKRRRTRDSKHELLRLDPTLLAENLCLYESTLYSKIRIQECLEWIRTRSGDPVANLLAFCGTYDRLASWVKYSVLWASNLNQRADLVDFWIKVAEKCRGMHNYSSMSAIVSALSSTAISGLHLTLAHVNKTMHLALLTELNDPSGNFSAFRQVQRSCNGPCVPFVGPYLTDIIHIHDQYRDTTITTSKGSLPMFNFVRRRKWTDALDSICRHQGKQYPFSQDASAMHQIETQLTLASGIEQSTFWSKSEEVQQEERTSADLRRGLEAAGF